MTTPRPRKHRRIGARIPLEIAHALSANAHQLGLTLEQLVVRVLTKHVNSAESARGSK